MSETKIDAMRNSSVKNLRAKSISRPTPGGTPMSEMLPWRSFAQAKKVKNERRSRPRVNLFPIFNLDGNQLVFPCSPAPFKSEASQPAPSQSNSKNHDLSWSEC